jgi:5'-3' exonuclease
MGIYRFFHHVLNNFPECLHLIKKGEDIHNFNFDSYSLDLNAIIHPVCQKTFCYGEYSSLLQKFKKPDVKTGEKKAFYNLVKKIDELTAKVNPNKELNICIDGVAGLSKLNQQRGRRFKSATTNNTNKLDEFDPNCITTGTEFMNKLSSFLYFNFQKKSENDNWWKTKKIFYSNDKVAGEGEHTIIHRIKKNGNNKDKYCIHSPDADLIMLTLPILNRDIYILRENVYRDIDAEYFLVDVKKYRELLLKKITNISTVSSLYMSYDFITACFFLGNDFLPHTPSLEIGNRGLEAVLENLQKNIKKGNLVEVDIFGELYFNPSQLYLLIKNLSRYEADRLVEKKLLLDSKKFSFPDELLNECYKNNNETENLKFDFVKYRKLYYLKLWKQTKNLENNKDDENLENVPKSFIDELCFEYLKGLLFVLRYYTQQIPDWLWCYPYHKTPLFYDLRVYLKKNPFSQYVFTKHEPLTVFEQLICVLPIKSKQLLPQVLQPLLSEGSNIYHFYPQNFETDIAGKLSEHEGHPLLPKININLIKEEYNKLRNSLNNEEKKRERQGKDIIFQEGKTIFIQN